MIKEIGRIASDNDISHVFVAGDVWNSEKPSGKMLRQPLDLMAGFGDLTWWLMPGNHDPYRRSQDMLWSRIKDRAPENVRLLLEQTPIEVATSVWLLPAPWTNKSPGRDLTEWMDKAAADLPEDVIKIGLGHGSITDFSSSDGERSDAGAKSIIDPRRADLAGLDYLALGDWHGVQQISDKVWYSGTPETDRFRRNDPGHILLVSVSRGGIPEVRSEKTSSFSWEILDIDCLHDVDEFPDINRLEALGSLRHVLIQMNITGEITQKNWMYLERRLQDLEESADFLDIRRDGLTHLVSDEDLDELDQGGSVRMVAECLRKVKEGEGTSEITRKVAADALQILLSYSKEGAQS